MNLSEINIYPVKSLSGISLNDSNVEDRGLAFDRRWMIVNEKGEIFTQREFPKMATLKTAISDKTLQISVGNNSIDIPFEPTTKDKIKVKVWQSRCDAILYNSSVNNWFSEVLETKCQLVMMPESTKRKVSAFYAIRKFEDVVSFADAYPVLLIGENSLNDLNEKLEKPVSMNRFRPNVVIADAEAFEEDNWKKIKIGKVIFHLVKPCARCVMTTIDQSTGISAGKEPLRTLAKYRLKKSATGQKILFGQNLIAENFGAKIHLGDKIEILEVRKRKFRI